ncbi:MAG: helix-hairpin-helix domain-containing protein [Planctomycetaceae bacterium]|nr:helix-hairpin-helix domain-containing protein [Planctomycetaceae bacterium]
MVEPVTINLSSLSGDLGLPQDRVQSVIKLLDEGYPIPFIARYRKDITGNLDEEKIRLITSELRLARSLAERKQAILKAIDALGVLTDELDKKIREAQTIKLLEDLYLPYKPKKNTLAGTAKGCGLSELADEILNEKIAPENLDARAAEFINEDKKIKSVADALLGAGHIIAEILAEKNETVQKIREIIRQEGKLSTKKIETKKPDKPTTTENEQKNLETNKDNLNKTKTDNNNEPPKNKEIPNDQVDQLNQIDQPETDSTEPKTETTTENKIESETNINSETAVKEIDKEEKTNDQENITIAQDEQAATHDAQNEEQAVESGDGGADVAANVAAADGGVVGGDVAEASNDANEITEQFQEIRDTLIDTGTTSAKSKVSTAQNKRKTKEKEKDQNQNQNKDQQHKSNNKTKEKDAERKRRREDLKAKEREQFERQFSDYFDFSCSVTNIPAHRILAFNRGERERVLRVDIEVNEDKIVGAVCDLVVPKDHKFAEFLSGCLRDAVHRLLIPMLERELRLDMTEYAEEHSVHIFAKNLRGVLLQPPLHRKRVIAIDPGFKHGCKIVPLDEFGNVLDFATIYLANGSDRKLAAIKKLAELIKKYKSEVIAIGNGTGCRETEQAVSKLISDGLAGSDVDVSYVIVNEAGASTYASSQVGKDEFPHYDLPQRGTISIGRRLQNPLNELVKVEPESLGVGMYLRDVKVKRLRDVLGEVVESCVNYVGVDVNSATPSMLRFVAGLNKLTAQRLYAYRIEQGRFNSREEFLKVSGISGTTYTNCAGFLKVYGGTNPFDATWIHPENYPLATRILAKLGFVPEDLRSVDKQRELAEKILAAGISELAAQYAAEFEAGQFTVTDILTDLAQPNRDPRESLPPPIFKKSVLRFEDLTLGMELTGAVLNVVDFGAFVDVGLHEPGLVHISQMSDRYIRDAYDKVSVGDIVRVWVTELDLNRHRISLTMLSPGTVRELKRNTNLPDTNRQTGDAPTQDNAKNTRPPRSWQRREPNREAGSSNYPRRTGSTSPTTQGETTNQPASTNRNESGERSRVRLAAPSQRNSRTQTSQPTQTTSTNQPAKRGGTGLWNNTTNKSTSENRDVLRNNSGGGEARRNDGRRNDRRNNWRDEKDERRTRSYVATSTKEKNVKPITEKMRQGKEPLRSFGDLAQLLGRVQVADPAEEKKRKKEQTKNTKPPKTTKDEPDKDEQNINDTQTTNEVGGVVDNVVS